MAGTTLQDVIVPELFTKYVVQKTMELSALFNSGIVVNNAEFDRLASEAAPIHNMPFFEDLQGSSEAIIEGTDLTANGIKSNKDVSVTIRRGMMWSATDLSAALAGADPMAAVGDLVAAFWARDMQKELISILNGVFSASTMSKHVLDVSLGKDAAANISASVFIDGLQMLGDAQSQLTAVAMHSAVKSYLKKQNLITTQRDSNSVEFETYQDRRVIIDDGCPCADGVYTTYLFGNGAIAFGNGNPVGFTTHDNQLYYILFANFLFRKSYCYFGSRAGTQQRIRFVSRRFERLYCCNLIFWRYSKYTLSFYRLLAVENAGNSSYRTEC